MYPKESNEASPHSGIEPQEQISEENRFNIISVLLGTSSFSILKQNVKSALSTIANDSHVQRVCRCSIAKRARDCKSLTDHDLNPTITQSSSELLELLQPGKVENALARVVVVLSPDCQYD